MYDFTLFWHYARSPEDTEDLKYYIEATSLRCKPVKSGDIQVKNPKVISMEWDKKAIYWGDEIELIIKTIEMHGTQFLQKLLLSLNEQWFFRKKTSVF